MASVDEPTKIAPASSGFRGHRRNFSTDILERARLELIIPRATNLDILAALESSSKKDESHSAMPLETPQVISSKTPNKRGDAIPSMAIIPQRTTLFYDEEVPVFIALQIIGIQDDAVYESYSSRLAVSLEVTAIEPHGRKSEHGTTRESSILLYQKTIHDKDSSKISWKNGDTRLAIWKLTVPLGHPKVKTMNPKVVFSASATLRFMNQMRETIEDEYITSRQSFGMNLLETFGTGAVSPVISEKPPYLSSARVSRVIPTNPTPKETFSPLGYTSKKTFSILPALNFKLRGTKLTLSKNQEMIACLHLEVTPHAGCDIRIDDLSLIYPDGVASMITESTTLHLPLVLHPMDEITFLFALQPPQVTHTTPSPSASMVKQIIVKLKGQAIKSAECHPYIATHWETTIDFSGQTRPKSVQNVQRSLRPVSRGNIMNKPSSIPPNFQPHYTTHSNVEMPGLSITFTGPNRVYVGESFSWQVFVVNRSSRHRKLALVIPPKRRKGDSKNLPSLPTSMTEPVLDDVALHSTYKAQYMEPIDLISLINDVKVGPLAPNACHNAELRFIPLATGVLNLDGVRVIDVLTNEVTDCRDLPSIICINKPS